MSKRIAYLAPYNSTSAEVAVVLGKRGYGFLECVTPIQLIQSIDSDTYGVIPLEDCIDATASESLNALINTDRQVFISKKYLMQPDFRIFVIKGVGYRDILKVKTPVHAYEMCRQNINEIMPQAKIEFVSSTDRAIEELNETTCAIASVINSAKHLAMGSTSITDSDAFRTSFGFLTNDLTVAKDANTTLLTITVANIKGAIATIADIFDRHDIKVKSFKTHSVTDQEIKIIAELAINARAKDMRDAIVEINNEVPSLDAVNSSELQVEPTQQNKVKILGCF